MSDGYDVFGNLDELCRGKWPPPPKPDDEEEAPTAQEEAKNLLDLESVAQELNGFLPRKRKTTKKNARQALPSESLDSVPPEPEPQLSTVLEPVIAPPVAIAVTDILNSSQERLTRSSLARAAAALSAPVPTPVPASVAMASPALAVAAGGRRGRGRGRGGVQVQAQAQAQASGSGRGRGSNRRRGRGTSSAETGNLSSIAAQAAAAIINCTHDDYPAQMERDRIMAHLISQGQEPSVAARNAHSEMMYARRRVLAELAARSTTVDYVDLVSSPWPRVEGVIDLVDTPENDENTSTSTETASAANTTTSTPNDDLSQDESFNEDNPLLSIKVLWRGKLDLLPLRKYQKFEHIMQILAEREKTDAKNIIFNLSEKIIMPTDTPDTINYKVFQIINGRVADATVNSLKATPPKRKKRDVNNVALKIQSDLRKHPLCMELAKTEKFRILYIKCAEEFNIPIKNIKLSFDGDVLEHNATPTELELEGGEAIDLRVLK